MDRQSGEQAPQYVQDDSPGQLLGPSPEKVSMKTEDASQQQLNTKDKRPHSSPVVGQCLQKHWESITERPGLQLGQETDQENPTDQQ